MKLNGFFFGFFFQESQSSDRYSQPIENHNGGPGGVGAIPAAAQADYVRNKHTGKKGEFRYF